MRRHKSYMWVQLCYWKSVPCSDEKGEGLNSRSYLLFNLHKYTVGLCKSPLLDIFSVLKFHVVMKSQEIQMCWYNESILKGQMFWYTLRSAHFCLFGIVSLFNVKELNFLNIIRSFYETVSGIQVNTKVQHQFLSSDSCSGFIHRTCVIRLLH